MPGNTPQREKPYAGLLVALVMMAVVFGIAAIIKLLT